LPASSDGIGEPDTCVSLLAMRTRHYYEAIEMVREMDLPASSDGIGEPDTCVSLLAMRTRQSLVGPRMLIPRYVST
jgi:hypothetical protein